MNIIMESSDIEKVNIVMRQTDYTEDIAREKLLEFENNEILVIKNYLGITHKKTPTKSLNQEIYKQIRHRLDDSMKVYNKKIQEKLEEELKNNQD
jgi:hypothetical protein